MQVVCAAQKACAQPAQALGPLHSLHFFVTLQEVSLLADLRAVVARALSGLDMFSDADGKLSPTVSGSIGGASRCSS
jgi:hypothetical protein